MLCEGFKQLAAIPLIYLASQASEFTGVKLFPTGIAPHFKLR